MLCGEYAVTIGIEALALPVTSGQWMHVWEFDSPGGQDRIIWEAKDEAGNTWLNESFSLPLMHEETSDIASKKNAENDMLRRLLASAPAGIWKSGKSYRFETQLEFDRKSGLGSSSTLVSNFARFAHLDAQKLQQDLLGGSGYDVAVAELGKGLVFWKEDDVANWGPWGVNPSLTQQWKVVFLGEKQNSRSSLAGVRARLQEIQNDDFMYHQLQQVAGAVKMAQQVTMLEAGLEMWQALLSMSLGLETPYQHFGWQPVKGGLCKWLGAWGGDMLLVNDTFAQTHMDVLSKYKSTPWNQLIKY
jgi:mevalonate kinase